MDLLQSERVKRIVLVVLLVRGVIFCPLCPSLFSCQSLLRVGLDASLFHAVHARAALIEAVNQLASAVEINDGSNVMRRSK